MSNTLSTTVQACMTYSMLLKHLCAALCCVASLGALADAPFTVSVDGQEVTDAKTGLVWRRCAEGLVASINSCTGVAVAYTHESALTQANNQTGWRLPNVQELMSIADRSRQFPSIDGVAFPSTPASAFWSSSPETSNADSAWFVVFSYGQNGYFLRNSFYYVRLVRAGQ